MISWVYQIDCGWFMMTAGEERAEGFRALKFNFLGNILLTIIKGVVGVLAQSQAMISDAFHSLSDILSTLVSYVAIKIAHRPADEDHHYGHGRAETVAAKIVGLLIIFTALGIGYRSVVLIREGGLVSPQPLALWVALFSLLLKELMYRYSIVVGRSIGSKAVEADAKHHRSDALSSLVVVIGIAGARMGYPLLDPLAGLVVAIMILRLGGELYWDSISELVDTAPEEDKLQAIVKICQQTEGVIEVSEVKARRHGSQIYVDLKVCVNRMIPVVEGHGIAHRVAENVEGGVKGVKEVLVHINPCYLKREEREEDECTHCSRQKNGNLYG